jgi:hypothetical protein
MHRRAADRGPLIGILDDAVARVRGRFAWFMVSKPDPRELAHPPKIKPNSPPPMADALNAAVKAGRDKDRARRPASQPFLCHSISRHRAPGACDGAEPVVAGVPD